MSSRTSRQGRWHVIAVVAAVLGTAAQPSGAAAAKPEQVSLRIVQDRNAVSVLDGDRLLLEYRYGDVPFKPYVSQLFTPGGVNVLRDAPHDHLHHHAMMYAIAVDGVDFWAENPEREPGKQVHRSLEGFSTPRRGPARLASFTHQLDWRSADQTPLVSERRTIEVRSNATLGASLVTWRTQLEPAPGKDSVTLSGSHYFGLGVRFVESMDKVGRFFNADALEGELVRNQERLFKSRWCAYTAPAEGKPVTVAVFDHPNNPRHPAGIFTMATPFAYLSATLNLWKEPLPLSAGARLDLRYGVALWDGEVDAGEVERVYQHWVDGSSTRAGPGTRRRLDSPAPRHQPGPHECGSYQRRSMKTAYAGSARTSAISSTSPSRRWTERLA